MQGAFDALFNSYQQMRQSEINGQIADRLLQNIQRSRTDMSITNDFDMTNSLIQSQLQSASQQQHQLLRPVDEVNRSQGKKFSNPFYQKPQAPVIETVNIPDQPEKQQQKVYKMRPSYKQQLDEVVKQRDGRVLPASIAKQPAKEAPKDLKFVPRRTTKDSETQSPTRFEAVRRMELARHAEAVSSDQLLLERQHIAKTAQSPNESPPSRARPADDEVQHRAKEPAVQKAVAVRVGGRQRQPPIQNGRTESSSPIRIMDVTVSRRNVQKTRRNESLAAETAAAVVAELQKMNEIEGNKSVASADLRDLSAMVGEEVAKKTTTTKEQQQVQKPVQKAVEDDGPSVGEVWPRYDRGYAAHLYEKGRGIGVWDGSVGDFGGNSVSDGELTGFWHPM